VAKRLYAIYMRQLFETHFVHADPHPGNLFVRPLETGSGEHEIAFVDFGMVTEIPERLRSALREFAIGLATRDARRMVESYVAAGSLLPDADIDRLVEAHDRILQHLWGVPLGAMRDVALSEAQEILTEYRDLLLSAPIQLQADMLFASRSVGLLAGLCTTLDPAFEPWSETVPFAERFAREQRSSSLPEMLDHVGKIMQGLIRLPTQVERILNRADHGTLGVQMLLGTDARSRVQGLERAVDRLSWMVGAGALLVSGAVLTAAGSSTVPRWLFAGAAISALIGLLKRR
jgi:predicted unusual protein kinase regulating ubiquinone biosynthesis (AarF/ABC1/UbiB family)